MHSFLHTDKMHYVSPEHRLFATRSNPNPQSSKTFYLESASGHTGSIFASSFCGIWYGTEEPFGQQVNGNLSKHSPGLRLDN